VLAVVGAAVLAPALAAAGTITSSNWAGYAVHKPGMHFKRITSSWQEPAGTCTAGTPTYSAFWVGIGGYSLTASALEQIGTELDCNADGTSSYSAWYEMVPSDNRSIAMTIRSGDVITGTVTVVGHRVTLSLTDDTRHETFRRTFTPATVDTTSAEWIAEAPSDCSSASKCTVLPLTDFAGVLFGKASATSTSGRTSTISSSMWTATKILLGYARSGTAFTARASAAHATPTALSQGGAAFAVAYSGGAAASSTSSGSGSSSGGGTGSPRPGGFGPGLGGVRRA
jgi:hypothetical protein